MKDASKHKRITRQWQKQCSRFLEAYWEGRKPVSSFVLPAKNLVWKVILERYMRSSPCPVVRELTRKAIYLLDIEVLSRKLRRNAVVLERRERNKKKKNYLT